ncbi:MAG TPA: c-type cytochrome [Gammaproteobacteria bacterium]|nr:c-type cytochrome [Gammaproteobacteria bacterium]
MNRKIVLGTLLSVVCAVLPAAASAQEGDPKAGQVKAIPCMGCHGIPGYSNVYPSYHVPRVGGQHAQYLVAALKAYKNGDRSHKTMQAQAATLSDQDIADIAAYFAAAQSD